jgi:hypothetical protein
MPITATLLLMAGLALAATPGFAAYATHAVALDALAQQPLTLRLLAMALPAVLLAALAIAPALAAYRAVGETPPRRDVSFSLLLAAGLALFFSVSVGLAPSWLYDLMPSQLTYAPYELDRVGGALQLSGAAGLTAILLYALRVWPQPARDRLLDVDALYRGPLVHAGRWFGIVALRLYGGWLDLAKWLLGAATGLAADWVRRQDRPYEGAIRAVWPLAAIGAALCMALWFR